MSRKGLIITLAVIVAAGAVGFFVWRHYEASNERMASLERFVGDAEKRLAVDQEQLEATSKFGGKPGEREEIAKGMFLRLDSLDSYNQQSMDLPTVWVSQQRKDALAKRIDKLKAEMNDTL